MQLVPCCLTKNDTVQHMEMKIDTNWSGNIGHEKIHYY